MGLYILTIKDARVKFGAAPTGGAAIDAATLDDYSCSVTEARIAASANTVDVPATFCSPASQTAAGSSFTLELNGLQDWGRTDEEQSFSEFMFVNDATIVAFALFLDGEVVPKAQGLVTAIAGDFGGVAGEPLTFTGSLPILGKPEITITGTTPLMVQQQVNVQQPITNVASQQQSEEQPTEEPAQAF